MTNEPQTFPIEEVARLPLPGMAVPAEFAFSPDGQLITYLYSPQRSLVRQLYGYNLGTGEHDLLVLPPEGGASEETVSLEEALRRERMRQRELGITRYAWCKKTGRVLVPVQGDIYIGEEPGEPLQRILESGAKPALDARFSPNGAWVAYVQDDELSVIPAAGGEPHQLTAGARGTGRTHGLAEFVAQEEMSRRQGYWWSPDSQWLAFQEADETHIPVYRIMHQGKDKVGLGAQEDHRYPFAGGPNARVRLGVVSVAGGEPVWMDLGEDEDIYLARVDWMPDGRLCAQLENRAQTVLDLVAFNPKTGERSSLLSESSEVWINLHDMFKPLISACNGKMGCFIWASERDGFQHLYLYDAEGNFLRQLTQGEWMVEKLIGVDEQSGLVYFMATEKSPLESHLYVVSVDGGMPRRISQEPGMRTVKISPDFDNYVETRWALDTPPVVTLRSLADGALCAIIFDERDARLDELDLNPPEIVTLENRLGDDLYGAIYRPPESFGSGPYPTLVWVYGGPHAQLVTNSWGMTVNMRAQYLSRQGFLVFVLDNRGSARRGLAFEGGIRHNMGHLEVEDQADGVNWLVEQGMTDPARVGVYGWSYGGYMSLMCLALAPQTFKAAVSGAPVTAWDGYDTHYTERYMGKPTSNPQGYQNSSVMAHIHKLQGKLLLVHGLIDENVHFRHTARLINAMIAARIPYELMLFPDERHSPRKLQDRVYMEERLCDFFKENL